MTIPASTSSCPEASLHPAASWELDFLQVGRSKPHKPDRQKALLGLDTVATKIINSIRHCMPLYQAY